MVLRAMRLPRARKIARRLALLLVTGACLFAVSAVQFAWRCTSAAVGFEPTRNPAASGFSGHTRPEEDTFFTYPEWFIVWSYQEKADFQQKRLPSAFPYFGSIRQYWRGYCCANRIVRGRYPFNFGDHLMLATIGSSFSLEYALKGAYEKTIGYATERLSGFQPVPEDVYAARVAREYADFVHIRPFYEFPFFRSLGGLWKNTRLWGPHALRKWERKLWLSLDYAIEGSYCGLMEKFSHAVYGVETDETYALIENAPDTVFVRNPRIRKVQDAGPGAYLISMPRYQEFTEIAMAMARQGVRFRQIAGNEQILVTVIVPADWHGGVAGAETLFTVETLTDRSRKRIALRCPVAGLHGVLHALTERGAMVEHIYDY